MDRHLFTPVFTLLLGICCLLLAGGSSASAQPDSKEKSGGEPLQTISTDGTGYSEPELTEHEQRYMSDLQQLTFGGQNAEAYWSPDGEELILQVTTDEYPCDQIYRYDLSEDEMRLVSTGDGKTTCSFFGADGERFIYASTHLYMDSCPPPPDYSMGYVWPIHPEYEIFLKEPGEELERLTDNWGYDAEGALDWTSPRMVFTSLRDGDLDLYLKNLETGELKQLTDQLGYDGGPFFSQSGEYIVYRRGNPDDEAEITDYKNLLDEGLIRPGQLEIMVMDSDGSDKRQLTDNGAANFAPYMHTSDEYVIYSSNHDAGPREFDLWIVPREGGEPRRVTTAPEFDSFPMFSPSGDRIVFASNRNGKEEGETNIFLADWDFEGFGDDEEEARQ